VPAGVAPEVLEYLETRTKTGETTLALMSCLGAERTEELFYGPKHFGKGKRQTAQGFGFGKWLGKTRAGSLFAKSSSFPQKSS